MKNSFVRPARVSGLFAVAVLLAWSTAGCDLAKKLQKARDEVAKADGTSKGKSDDARKSSASDDSRNAAAEPDEALGDKLNHAIECINHASHGVSRSRERYLEWVKDPKVGPTGAEPVVYGLYEVQDFQIKKCKDELKALAAMKDPPTPDLDKAATAYGAALDAVVPLIADAFKYYDQKNYKDDHFKKGKDSHPALMKAMDAFESAAEELDKQVSTLKQGLSERELAAIEKHEGKKLAWHEKKLMLVAKQVVDVGGNEDAKIDVTKLDAAVKDLESITEATKTYAKAHADEDSSHMFAFVENSMDEYLKAAKSLFRRLRDKTPFSDGDKMMMDNGRGAEMVDGTQDKLVKDYNALVEAMNNTQH